MTQLLKALRLLIGTLFAGFTAGIVMLFASYLYIEPRLPGVSHLRAVHLQVPLRIYTADGALIAEFGEKRRIPVRYEDVPPLLIHAFLAAEDERFFQHPGVDYHGILRAAFELMRTGRKSQGGSTITMQVARNFFLGREKTFSRKLREIFLALKINRELTKQEVLALYLNKIYLGNRAYGIGAAAQIYYGRSLDRLSLAQVAMLAGLPKAPSRDNPVADPGRARSRRAYVLGRMLALGYINAPAYEAAMAEPLTAALHGPTVAVRAPYVAELVRAQMLSRYGARAYSAGFRVYTTLDSRLQRAARRALRDGLLAYDRRHGYRGPAGRIGGAALSDAAALERRLGELPTVGGLRPAIVTALRPHAVEIGLGGGRRAAVDWDGLSWARRYAGVDRTGPVPQRAADILAPGDIVYLKHRGTRWSLAQVPAIQGALVALNPNDGALRALVGGFDYDRSKFNRVIQAERQPGSSFKPFIYSAALHKGYTAASLINDAPLVFRDPALENLWRPENYGGHFHGPTRLREGLVHSRNLVSIRLLRAIGIPYAVAYARRFGFDTAQLPRNLSLALGSASVTPLQMARAYAVFANGGYRVRPFYVERIVDAEGRPVFETHPATACPRCTGSRIPAGAAAPPAPRAISAQNDYIMVSMMEDVVRRGTGRGARALKRADLAGKTGTTNDQRDAWFCGFSRGLTVVTWVGFDRPAPLGRGETGARAALPIWIEFMRAALRGIPPRPFPQPPGIVTLRIDRNTGRPSGPGNPGAMFEIFRAGHTPRARPHPPRPGGRRSPAPLF